LNTELGPPPAGLRGRLHLEAARRPDGRTILARQSFCVPFHLGKAYWDGRVLQARLANPTAGILAGDRLELGISVSEGAALAVLTPAATRAFTMRGDRARCRQAFEVAVGAWLEWAPEPLYPHRGSDYEQKTTLDMAAGSEAYFVETLAPGRAGRGEIWAWRALSLSLTVRHSGDPVLRERLAASGEELAAQARFHGMAEAWFGTVVAISPRLIPDDSIAAEVNELHGAGRWVGATRLPCEGWLLRIIAPSSPSLREALLALRGIFSRRLPQLRSDLRRM
jgi:urease accessory protein